MNAVSTAPTSAMAVANWFLKRASKDEAFKTLDQLKLYKLVFFAHAWHLGNGQGPLFDEDVEAWPHGPVVRDLYIQFKDAGRGPITSLGSRFAIRDGKFASQTPVYAGELEPFLESVWMSYKRHSGIQLSNATHAPGEPWTIVSEKVDLSCKPTIPNELIEQVYRAKVEGSRQH
ncbi:MAG: DUF4065 domain-containing protein [Tabrizicola sp.]|nr:DUF4065 domain-containing protein [Tabrizicola sp.]